MSGKGDVCSNPASKLQITTNEDSLGDIPDDLYEGVSLDRAKEILRQAELRREALLSMAAAADDRAVQFLVAASALAAAAVGAAAALGTAGSPPWVVSGLAGAAVCYVVAAAFAAWAARPEVNYNPPGIAPDQLWNPDSLRLSETELVVSIIGAAHTAIWKSQNASQLRGKWIQRALWTAAAAPILGCCIATLPWLFKVSVAAWAKVAVLV